MEKRKQRMKELAAKSDAQSQSQSQSQSQPQPQSQPQSDDEKPVTGVKLTAPTLVALGLLHQPDI